LLIKTVSSLGDSLDPLFLLFDEDKSSYFVLQSCRAKQLWAQSADRLIIINYADNFSGAEKSEASQSSLAKMQ